LNLCSAATNNILPANGGGYAGVNNFEIKREEKYLVFKWMSRQERAVPKKWLDICPLSALHFVRPAVSPREKAFLFALSCPLS